jgi:pyruvate formate lyase activating enzyme
MNWRENPQVAMHWHPTADGKKIECSLCPRHCITSPGQHGFCHVRGNIDNVFHTFNFGRSVVATEECIETEAVNHYSPGSKILSLGNIGCMMSCTYCQNWQTSQVKHLNDNNVVAYTPEEVIDIALSNNIGVISWTYNDPVVWHEFVLATSRLAKKAGIKTLYKSALYIELDPLRELIEVIDIFSISLKCMNDDVYRKITKGRLQPVLDAIEEIGKSGRHLEISQLVVTDLNDDGTDARASAKWIVEHVGAHVPFHLVAYHPAYKYDKPRTPVSKLLELREIVMNEGIQYCYLGNVYRADVSNTYCKGCDNKLVERFGLTVNVMGLTEDGCCTNCGLQSPIKEPLAGKAKAATTINTSGFEEKQRYEYEWNKEVKSLHIMVNEQYDKRLLLKVERFPCNKTQFIEMNNGLDRIILSKSDDEDLMIRISVDNEIKMHYLPVLDRAHFPVIEDSPETKKYLN